MEKESVKLAVLNGEAFAILLLPLSIKLRRIMAERKVINDLLKTSESDLVETYADADERHCILRVPVNPFADAQVRERMTLLQHIAKRTMCYAPALDVTNLAEVQHQVLQ